MRDLTGLRRFLCGSRPRVQGRREGNNMRGLPAAVMSLRFIASPGESVKSRLQHCETSLAVHLLREASPLSCCRASCAETRHVPGLSRVKRGERRTFCSVREHAARALEHERGSCGRQPQAWREPSSHKPLALCLSARSKPPFQGDGGSQRREPMSEQALRARVRAHDLRPRRRTKAPHARDRHGAARRAACGCSARRKPSGRVPDARGVSGGKVLTLARLDAAIARQARPFPAQQPHRVQMQSSRHTLSDRQCTATAMMSRSRQPSAYQH